MKKPARGAQGRGRSGAPSTTTFTATEAQNNFGAVMDRVQGGRVVTITRRNHPAAVVIPYDQYQNMIGQEPVDLQALETAFDDLVDRMQGSTQRQAVAELFSLSATDLGKAAVAAARKTRKG